MTQYLVVPNQFLKSATLLQTLWLETWVGVGELGQYKQPWNRGLGTK